MHVWEVTEGALPAWHPPMPSFCGILEAMKNFHVPLPDPIYQRLRAEAERTEVPATSLAREAIDEWLRQQRRKSQRDAIAAYAAEMAGTALDLDADLESAAVEHLIKSGSARKRRT